MVAGDEEAALLRAQAGERRDVIGELGHRAIDQVAGDRDPVAVEAVHGLDDRLDVLALDRRPDRDVADLRDREPVEPADQGLRRDQRSSATVRWHGR